MNDNNPKGVAHLKGHLSDLEEWFSSHTHTITAFSGGVDSALVLYLSYKFLGKRAIGCISISPSLKRSDYATAIAFCKQYKIRLEIIETKEIDDPNYFNNPSNRCYFCKSHLYQHLKQVSLKYPESSLLNGTNTDDISDYRPGIKAADELDIFSPLVDCGITKQTVRDLANYFGLPNSNKPASPCLSSRIPYGSVVTREKLSRIEQAEEILAKYGFNDTRVRHFDETASIEVPYEQIGALENIMPQVGLIFKGLGFRSVSIDREGLVSGKLNRPIRA